MVKLLCIPQSSVACPANGKKQPQDADTVKIALHHRCLLQIVVCLAFAYFAGSLNAAEEPVALAKSRAVKIEYIAHACFRVTSPSGKQILLDPYASRVWLGYDFPTN